MPHTFTTTRLVGFIFLFISWFTTEVKAQQKLCVDEVIINTYQPDIDATKIVIKKGFSVGNSQTFIGEVCEGITVPPDETCVLTVSEGMSVKLGQSFPLTASFNCNLPGKAYSFDGLNDLVSMPDIVYPSTIASNFTWEAWVNPNQVTTNTITLQTESTNGTSGLNGQKYLVHPTNGDTRWGSGHVGMGISFAKNGISVYEHGSGYLTPLLSVSQNFTGWTHIAVVYVNNKPTLYINGVKTKDGLQSSKTVHPSLGFGGGQYGYYNGQLDEVKIWNASLSEQQITARYNKIIPFNTVNLIGNWHLNEQFGTIAKDASNDQLFGILYNGITRVNSGAPLQTDFTWTASPASGSGIATFLTGNRIEIKPSAVNTYTYTVNVTDARGYLQTANVIASVNAVGSNLPPQPGPLAGNYNYIVENTISKGGITSDADLSMPVEDMSQTITYLDGLGRTMQQVTTQGSPEKKDIVQPMEYDILGRSPKSYLSYTATTANGIYKTDALTAQAQQYTQFYGDANAFAQSRFELSPLNRVVEQGTPGSYWQLGQKTHKSSWRTNQPSEVRYWKIGANGIIDGTTFYTNTDGQGELMVTETLDEQNYKNIEYKDVEGHVVCKKVQENEAGTSFLITYYVYDDLGFLRYILTPEAVERATTELTTDYIIDPANAQDQLYINKWLYSYHYDNKGRITEKLVPGAGPVYTVYNKRNQPILTQEGRQRNSYNSDGISYAAHQWNFTKYDALGRVVITGLYQHGSELTQAAMQDIVDGETILFEERSVGTGHVQGYTNHSFPSSNTTPLLVSYYDNYSYAGVHTFVPFNCTTAVTPSTRTRGMITGSKVRMMQSNEQWLITTSYYNEDGGIIETIADSHIQNGGVNNKEMSQKCLDFAGKLISSELRHQNSEAVGAKNHTIRIRTTYDHVARLKEKYQQIDNGTEERLATYIYNTLGEVVQKVVGKGSLQTIDYKYNIRGWLTHINNGQLNAAQNDKFALTLNYNTGSTGPFNGNISSQLWSSTFDKANRKYQYNYNTLNQFTNASYSATSAQNVTLSENYSMPLIEYDKNGNIETLKRFGVNAGTAEKPQGYGLVDDLTYSYNGNQLTNVRDRMQVIDQSIPGVAKDFMEGNVSETAIEFTYDSNGNLVSDDNKNLTTIQYNYLNLPSQVIFNGDADKRIVFVYDAGGIKRKKMVFTRNSNNTPITLTTDYVGSLIYEQQVLQFVPTAEGRALSPEVTGEGQFAYEYKYIDHLGNLRVSFRKSPDIPAYTAGMEPSRGLIEEAVFDNISDTRDNTQSSAGDHAAKVNASKVLGPWRTFVIRKGDIVTAKAFAHYETTGQIGNRWELLPYLQAFGGSYPATGEKTGNDYTRLIAGVNINIGKPTPTTGVPVAYIKWIFYDKDGVVIRSELKQVTASAATSWEQVIAPAFQATQDGSLQVLVANESEKPVWFDEIEIKHTQDLIVQENHYDPWGLELVGIQKAGMPEDDWKGQGKESIDDLALYWSDFGARFYDAQLGRWHVEDPANQFASPYLGMSNNPVNSIDPDGRFSFRQALNFTPLKGLNQAIDIYNGFKSGGFDGGLNVIGEIAIRQGMQGSIAIISGGLSSFAPIGILPGFGYGAITGAGIGALNAGITGGNVGRAALNGGILGGITGGITGGMGASQLGANIWTGYRAPHDFSFSGQFDVFNEDRLSYNDETLHQFYKDNFPGIKGVTNVSMKATAKGYKIAPNGQTFINPDKELVIAVTVPRVWKNGTGGAIFFSKYAFYSPEAMFLTMGHELGHVQHNLAGLQSLFSEEERHIAIYHWQVKAATANGWTQYGNNTINAYLGQSNLIQRLPEPAVDIITVPLQLLKRKP